MDRGWDCVLRLSITAILMSCWELLYLMIEVNDTTLIGGMVS